MPLSSDLIKELIDEDSHKREPLSEEERKRRGFNSSLKKYRISIEDYEKMVRDQKGRCKLCGCKPKKLNIDHNHINKMVRGLLCTKCNTKLGLIENWLLDIGLINLVEYMDLVQLAPLMPLAP